MEKTPIDHASHRTRYAMAAATALPAGTAAAWPYGHKPTNQVMVAVQALAATLTAAQQAEADTLTKQVVDARRRARKS